MNKSKSIIMSLAIILIAFSSCNKDETTEKVKGDFTVTIENVFEGKMYPENGTTGLIKPGESQSFSFNAGKGQNLSFAMMFVQSNDLFYAPNENGIPLYDGSGNAVTGNVTSMLQLWDAGTEVNEAPGTGMNQPPRQSGPNTGMTENGTVKLVSDVMDGFSYPMTSDIIKIELAHDGGTMFTATITNISNNADFMTPFAPGTWVINSGDQTPLFKVGSAASPGLEAIAEDGDNSKMNNNLTSKTGFFSPFAPGAFGINDAVFTANATASSALEMLAEDGNPSGFTNVFNTPEGASSPGPLLPGGKYTFTFSAEEGDVLSFATMLVQSNDWFVGGNDIQLFNNGTAISGDITNMVKLYDAGTETDEYAGAGNNQPLRQSGPNTGNDENGKTMEETSAGNHVPSVSSMVKVTIRKK